MHDAQVKYLSFVWSPVLVTSDGRKQELGLMDQDSSDLLELVPDKQQSLKPPNSHI